MKLNLLAMLMLAFFVFSSAASALSVLPSYPVTDSGTSQYYSVIYDSEEEAGVAAYITLQNTGSEPITQLTLEIPGTRVRLISAVQEVRWPSRYCHRWEDVCTNLSGQSCSEYIRKCASWATDYYRSSPVYYSLGKEIEQLSFSAKYAVSLDVPVPEGESAALILYYKASGSASKNLGVASFEFETVKIPYDADTVRVAVNVQPEVYLKGSKSQVRTLPNVEIASSFSGKAVASSELASFSRSITYQSGFVKQAYGLDPWESFVVKGSYSGSWLALYWQKVALWVAGILVAIISVVILASFLAKKARKAGSFPKVALLSLGSALASSFAAILVSLLIVAAGSNYSARSLVPLLLLLLMVVILAGLFIPSIYSASRYGFDLGLASFFMVFVVLLLAFIALFVALLLFSQPHYAYSIAESVVS